MNDVSPANAIVQLNMSETKARFNLFPFSNGDEFYLKTTQHIKANIWAVSSLRWRACFFFPPFSFRENTFQTSWKPSSSFSQKHPFCVFAPGGGRRSVKPDQSSPRHATQTHSRSVYPRPLITDSPCFYSLWQFLPHCNANQFVLDQITIDQASHFATSPFLVHDMHTCSFINGSNFSFLASYKWKYRKKRRRKRLSIDFNKQSAWVVLNQQVGDGVEAPQIQLKQQLFL